MKFVESATPMPLVSITIWTLFSRTSRNAKRKAVSYLFRESRVSLHRTRRYSRPGRHHRFPGVHTFPKRPQRLSFSVTHAGASTVSFSTDIADFVAKQLSRFVTL